MFLKCIYADSDPEKGFDKGALPHTAQSTEKGEKMPGFMLRKSQRFKKSFVLKYQGEGTRAKADQGPFADRGR